MKTLFLFVITVASALAQTQAASPLTGLWDWHVAGQIRFPESTVSGLPSASGVSGQVYVATDASTAGSCTVGSGSARSLCRSNGTVWESLGGGAGNGATNFSALTDFQVTNQSSTVQGILGCSSSTPCIYRQGSQGTSITTSPITATLSGPTNGSTVQVFWYRLTDFTVVVGHNSLVTTVTCSGCTAVSGIVAFPAGAVPIKQTTFVNGLWDAITPAMEKRASMSATPVQGASGVACAEDPTFGVTTCNTDPLTVPRYSIGTVDPISACTVGRDFYVNTSTNLLWSCTATNTWSKPGGGISWFGGTIVPPVPGSWSTFGSGGTSSTVTGVTGGNALKITGSSGGQNLSGRYITVAGGDFTKTFVLYANATAQANSEVGVGFSDGTKSETCNIVSSGAGVGFATNTIQYTNSTTVLGGVPGEIPGMASAGPMFFQLQRTGTALKCSWSPDGVNFFTIFNDAAPFLTADRLLVVVDPRGASNASTAILASFQ